MKEAYFKDIGSAELEPLSYYIKKFAPDFYMGMHNHPQFELMYASRGNFIFEYVPRGLNAQNPENVKRIPVHQGELIFIDSYFFHRIQIEEEEITIYNIELLPSPSSSYDPFRVNLMSPINYAALIEHTSLKKLAYNKNGFVVVPNLSDIDSAFRELITTLTKESTCTEDECCNRARMLLFFMQIAKSLTTLEQNNMHYVKKILLYIKHHLNQKICLDDIAKEVGYHKSYIASQFKKYTGKTIVQMVNEMRISKSLRLLRDTSLPVSEIVKQVGFPSYAQMIHEFNKTVKMSPTACRKVFLNDEFDYNSPKWSAIAVRVNEEDYNLNDEEFEHSFYRKNIKTASNDFWNYDKD